MGGAQLESIAVEMDAAANEIGVAARGLLTGGAEQQDLRLLRTDSSRIAPGCALLEYMLKPLEPC